MNYIALARKWRPRSFSQLLGQDHVGIALKNSLDNHKLHHAYLFTGTRGVGKTSVARLFAKAVNCEKGVSSTPCLQCSACLAIEQGRFIDLIEVDAASRTRVEDTRELLENVQYAPTNARYKVYLIDEVHMLSQHSFNALLKTLEEPPAHVLFLLATTDPQKLPITILSRCLQFNLKPVQTDVIVNHLSAILKEENIPHDADALPLIAQAADGSLRDALSILEQAIANTDTHLNKALVKTMLGYTQQDYALALLHAIANAEAENLIEVSQAIAKESGNFHYVIEAMLDHLHQISLHQFLPATSNLLTHQSETAALSKQFTPEDAQLLYHMGLKAKETLHLSPTLKIGFEMMLLKMLAFRPLKTGFSPPLVGDHIEKSSTETKPQPKTEPAPQHELVVPVAKPTPASSPQKPLEWAEIVMALKLQGLALSAAEQAAFNGKQGGEVHLCIAKGHESLFTPTVIKRIQDQLTHYYQEPIKIRLEKSAATITSPAEKRRSNEKAAQESAALSLQNDSFFLQLQEEFAGELIKGSIEPVEDAL